MSLAYPHLAERLFNVPLLVHPGKLNAIIAGLGSRLLGAELAIASYPDVGQDAEGHDLPAELFTRRKPESRSTDSAGYGFHEGIAIVSMMGALAHRTQFKADSTRILGYQQIVRDLEAAADDPDVHHTLMIADTPGGEVSGVIETTEAARELSARKPLTVAIDTLAASAGYWISSAAREIAIAPTGYAGSIGVVMTHVDISRALANDGVAVTHIYAGDRKVDGSPYQALAPEVRERFQADVDAIYQLFVDAVAANRGLSREAVMATQAAIYRAQAAVDLKLADRVATPDQLLAELAASRPRTYPVGHVARANVSTGAVLMTDKTTAGDPQQPANAITQADLDAAQQLGAEAERTRIFAIIDCDAAKDRPRAALALARKPAIDANTAADVLAGLPEEVIELQTTEERHGASEFEKHMQAIGNPKVAPDDEGVAVGAADLWDRVTARYQ